MNRDLPDKASKLSIDELIKRYRAGVTLSQLAKAAGVSINTVRRRILAAGFTCRPAGGGPARIHSVPIPGLQEILTRYANGEPVPALAKEFGLSRGRIYTALRKAGVPIRERGRPPGSEFEGKLTFAQREQLLADLRSAKEPTLSAIGKKYGVTHEMVRLYARKAGIIYYRNRERKARTAWRDAQRKLQHQADVRKRKKIKDAARAAEVDALEALYLANASNEEIFLKTGVRSVSSRIQKLRNEFPGRFPYRHPRPSPAAAAEIARAREARVAARAQEKEALQKKIQLLEELWNAGASMKEISRQTGYVDPSNAVKWNRKRYPGRFPYRHPKLSPAAAAEAAHAREARVAARAQEKEAHLKKIQLLEELWNAGASLKEISRQTGYFYPSNAVRWFRKRYPGRFLPREHSKIKGTKPAKR